MRGSTIRKGTRIWVCVQPIKFRNFWTIDPSTTARYYSTAETSSPRAASYASAHFRMVQKCCGVFGGQNVVTVFVTKPCPTMPNYALVVLCSGCLQFRHFCTK